ncbi:hypothetical protein RJ639_022829 [Escallonia herrerae]|uniref:Retrotransposon gag domain-containing protein n=1 Tax=Escallonia herrerae TaxID=1293975 RepID=A0AA89AE04_9ASTE|nr:hypothetical protein RJ639_022829 [Escallonia herrerae]
MVISAMVGMVDGGLFAELLVITGGDRLICLVDGGDSRDNSVFIAPEWVGVLGRAIEYTDSSPEQVTRAETPRRSIHRKRTPKFCSRERDFWKIVPRYPSPERSPPMEESGYLLSEAIEKAKLPPNFRMPQCDLYDRTGDPGEHVYHFETNMLFHQVSDAVMYRAFPTTLRKAAHAWFKSLQPRSIYSFDQLSDLFQKHFVSNHSQRKNSANLLNIVQEKHKSLACLLGRFNAATLENDNLDEFVKSTTFPQGLRPTSKFVFFVNKSPPDSKDIKTPHDDPLVIMIKAGNFDVKRVLVDNGSSTEVLFYDAFKKMNITTDRLRKMDTPLHGFSNHPITVEVADMPRIDPEVITHRLNVDPSKQPIKQKKRIFTPERQEKIEEEVDKLLTANFIEEIYYPDWIANVVMVPNSDEPLIKVLLSPEASGRLTVLQLSVAVEPESFLSAHKVLLSSTHFALDFKPQIMKQNMSISSQTEIGMIDQESCWMDTIIKYLSTGELPSERHEARNLRVKVARKQFDNNNFRTFCTSLLIDLRFTYVAHPPSNGQTENMNCSILQGLKKKLDKAKGAWVDELPKVLWVYRTSPHSVTGETHFLLCYGTEAMLPVEIGVPTIRA